MAAAVLGVRPPAAFAGPLEHPFCGIVPRDKKLAAEWLASLTARGTPTVVTGPALQRVGMPVGGLFCGTVYLSGDGRLWLWDIFNRNQEGVSTRAAPYQGRSVGPRDGAAYVEPLLAGNFRPIEQGFVLQTKAGGHESTRVLSADGFDQVSFTGEYPIGRVKYRAKDFPIEVDLEAFSPFVPLDTADSSLPATIFAFRVRNNGREPVELTLSGWLENGVCHENRARAGTRSNRLVRGDEVTIIAMTAASVAPAASNRPDRPVEDWSKPGYAGWKVEGTSFGAGPVKLSDVPAYQGALGGDTPFVVNSHATAPGKEVGERDSATGKLTSAAFAIDRDFLNLWVGGGHHAGKTCVRLVVDGRVVAEVNGRDNNAMAPVGIDVRPHAGKSGVIEIIDEGTGRWGNIGVGRIWLGDQPAGDLQPLEQLRDYGSMALALLGPTAEDVAARAEAGRLDGDGFRGDVPLADRLIGRLGRRVTLAPGAETEITFVATWFFPNQQVKGVASQGRHYAARFENAAAVARHIAAGGAWLVDLTRRWRDTWYDSTLPYWFLDRTMANTACLATTTCHRFKDGRFWAWEGIGCCAGTCTHVWQYAQAMGRLFPDVERDHRERVDFGLALNPDGAIRFRAENGGTYAIDGQAGRILGALREHQMSATGDFLKRVWPAVKRAMQRMIQTDGDNDGLLHGPLHNTLDADWHGIVPWICGLYHAALHAAAAMADDMGEADFARQCRELAQRGRENLDKVCWNETFGYYVQIPSPKAPKSIGVYDGCHIDQVYGAAWGRQVGLTDVGTPERVRGALKALWLYNFTPDVGPYRAVEKAGRWYAMPGDGGLLMVAYPFTPRDQIIGRDHWAFMYFNECMSGFEHQAAAHMIWEGMVTEGLAVTRAIHDRYRAELRNPYNEIECSDHYARAMASYGTFLAACGFELNAPAGHIGFAPRLQPEDFRAPFTSAEAWGTYEQKRTAYDLKASIQVRYGQLALRSIGLELAEGCKASRAYVDGRSVAFHQQGRRVVITLPETMLKMSQPRLVVRVMA